MKKLFLLCAAALTLAAHAEDITLDLTTATIDFTNPIEYDNADTTVLAYNSSLKDVWVGTAKSDADYAYLYVNEGTFMFEHYGFDTYWGGFTVSKVASDTLNQFACMAKGGVNGKGTPYLIGYYSEGNDFFTGEPYMYTKMIFKEEYYPKNVQVCQNTITMQALIQKMDPSRPFTKQDTLTFSVTGYDIDENETNTVSYYLAVDSIFNTTWATIDLSSIGKCIGLKFRMTSTDTGMYGMNTPAYFALDALTISTESPTTALQQTEAEQPKATKRLINGQLYIEQNNRLYTITGVAL